MKRIAAGDYSYVIGDQVVFSELLPDEGMDSSNQEQKDMSTVSVSNTLQVVKKLDKLFSGITRRKKHLNKSFKDLYFEKFDNSTLESPEHWLNISVTSSSSSNSDMEVEIEVKQVTQTSEDEEEDETVQFNRIFNQPQEKSLEQQQLQLQQQPTTNNNSPQK